MKPTYEEDLDHGIKWAFLGEKGNGKPHFRTNFPQKDKEKKKEERRKQAGRCARFLEEGGKGEKKIKDKESSFPFFYYIFPLKRGEKERKRLCDKKA